MSLTRLSGFEYINAMKLQHNLTYEELQELTEYSLSSVTSWFAPQGSDRFRKVPDRAVRTMQLKLKIRQLNEEVRKLREMNKALTN